jgi:hypothetical protein
MNRSTPTRLAAVAAFSTPTGSRDSVVRRVAAVRPGGVEHGVGPVHGFGEFVRRHRGDVADVRSHTEFGEFGVVSSNESRDRVAPLTEVVSEQTPDPFGRTDDEDVHVAPPRQWLLHDRTGGDALASVGLSLVVALMWWRRQGVVRAAGGLGVVGGT